jgi:hypothetical protein
MPASAISVAGQRAIVVHIRAGDRSYIVKIFSDHGRRTARNVSAGSTEDIGTSFSLGFYLLCWRLNTTSRLAFEWQGNTALNTVINGHQKLHTSRSHELS